MASIHFAGAQQPKVYRVGIITSGGAWYETIDGLRVGLKALGLEEGKQIILVARDTKGDSKATEYAARNFEKQKVDLIYTTATSVTIAAKRATADIPIVFCAGSDPVVLKLVESCSHPGGRLTGVYNPVTDLTAKRLEILKEIVPKLRRVVTSTILAILSPATLPNWDARLHGRLKSNGSNGTSVPSRNFKRASERSRSAKWMPISQCRMR